MAAMEVPATVVHVQGIGPGGVGGILGGMAATPPSTPTLTPAGEGVNVSGNSSLYVGDLDTSVDEAQLYDLFNRVAPVVSVRVCRDQVKHTSLGYGYVNFNSPEDALNAKELLNFTPIHGKALRIMFSNRDPTIRKSGHANVFIKNLDASVDNKALHDTFSAFGAILSCKLAVDSNGKSKGYGFVQFDKEEAAQNAINRLNGMLINDKQVYVGLFLRQLDRSRMNGSQKFTNVYVKNLPVSTTDDDLQRMFVKYGSITSAVVMKDENGKSRCFGFVNFQSPDDASAAVENLNGTAIEDKVLYVGKAQRKVEREAELKAQFEQEGTNTYGNVQYNNLYMKNLDDSVTDEKLDELFSPFGTITSSKVLVDSQGMSKGAGFVAFSSPEEAARALNEMNGKIIGRKPLYVAFAQRKEERKARLQAYFAQLQASGGIAPLPTGIPGFLPGAPPQRLSPSHLYYGHGAPGVLPPPPPHAAGYGFQQPLLPGIRPAGFASNFIMPYQLRRLGQSGQHRFGGRRGAGPHQQWVQQNPNQGLNRYVSNGRNGLDPSADPPQGLMGGPLRPVTAYAASGIPVPPLDTTRRSGPVAVSGLASALASASPEDQRLILGEHLFPLVDRLEHDQAGKVTGMLLEMDQTEVLHLIESPDALKKKVVEAMNVLRLAASAPSDVADHIHSLSSSN